MKSPKSIVAVVLLVGAVAFAVYYVQSNPWFNPRGASSSSGPPQAVEGHGPTPEQMAKWRDAQRTAPAPRKEVTKP